MTTGTCASLGRTERVIVNEVLLVLLKASEYQQSHLIEYVMGIGYR